MPLLPSPPPMYEGLCLAPAPCYSLDTCRRILLDRAVPNLLRAKHWYSPSYSSGRPPLRKSITRVPDFLLIDTRGSLATLKNLLLRVQWKLWTVGAGRSNNQYQGGFRALVENLRALVLDLAPSRPSLSPGRVAELPGKPEVMLCPRFRPGESPGAGPCQNRYLAEAGSHGSK